MQAVRQAPVALSRDQPIAVIDIGSNSIRLVVYQRLGRAPVAVFNEKVLCGLGRDLARTGRLNPEGVDQALVNLDRFACLLGGMGVSHVDVLATAAVRDAADGIAFANEIKRRCGFDVSVVSGAEEGRLAALGVHCGIPDAEGVVGDLGGGSLELVGLRPDGIDEQDTMPLGPLRLMDEDDGLSYRQQKVDAALEGAGWLRRYRGQRFYAVGGSWRALARVHMERHEYPLHLIHQYVAPAAELAEVAGLIARQRKVSLARLAGVSKRRIETLPAAALVMERLIKMLGPREIVFSALGLREGHLYDLLGPEHQAVDPLIEGCSDIAGRLDRFGPVVAIADWTAPVFAGDDGRFDRIRLATCLISDCCWGEHPDYRAEHALTWGLRLPLLGIEHAERAYLAAALYTRYSGDAAEHPALSVLSGEGRDHARTLGLALRLAHTLAGGAATLLDSTVLERIGGTLRLVLPEALESLAGDAVSRRLNALARAIDCEGAVVVAPSTAMAAG